MNSRLALPFMLVAFFFLALAFSVVIPLGEAADEVPHFSYVQFLVLHRALPHAEGQVSGESHQPPLYYFFGALVTAWIPQTGFDVIANPDFAFDDRNIPNLLVHNGRETFPYRADALAWHFVRLLSIILGGLTVWATGQIAREIFSDDQWIALGASAFVAFLPSFLALSAAVNNDNLIIALTALCVLQLVRMWHRSVDTRGTIILGLLLGASALAKLSGFVVWAFAAFIFFWIALRTGNWKIVDARAILCFGIAGALVTPWLVYNTITFGDPLGWSVLTATTPPRLEIMTWRDALGILQGLYTSFWGRFGGALQIHMASWVYAILGITGAIGLSGWVGYAFDARNQRLEAVRESFVLFTLFGFVMLIAYVRVIWSILGTDQARILFPGLPLFAIFFAAGWARVFGSRTKIAWLTFVSGLGAMSVGVLLYLRAIYTAS